MGFLSLPGKAPFLVIPAKAGIQWFRKVPDYGAV